VSWNRTRYRHLSGRDAVHEEHHALHQADGGLFFAEAQRVGKCVERRALAARLLCQKSQFLFHNDPARLREQVRDSNKNVVLIAPFLGFEYAVDDKHFAGNYSVEDLATPNWGERYLNEVLAALSHFLVPDARPPIQLQVDKLIIVCHSGGGVGMRNLVGNLGKYQSNLRACWGFEQPDNWRQLLDAAHRNWEN
jgi:hypothetical protein